MISGKELFAEISNEAVCEDGEVVGYFVRNSSMDTLEQMLCSTVTVKLPDEVDVLLNHLEDVLPFEVFQLIDAHKWNAVSRLSAAGIKGEAE
nr:MAG: hypothetical protein [Bacteriophage sp.]